MAPRGRCGGGDQHPVALAAFLVSCKSVVFTKEERNTRLYWLKSLVWWGRIGHTIYQSIEGWGRERGRGDGGGGGGVYR